MSKEKIEYVKQLFEDIDKYDDEVCKNLDEAENWIVLPEDEKTLKNGRSLTDCIYNLNNKLDTIVELLKNVVIDIDE